jgi:hypothetical protein
MALAPHPSAAICQCGLTTIELRGAPILRTTCYCESCRTAALGFETDLNAPKTVNADGGVDYSLYRKDRVKITNGAQNLHEYRLKPDSPTRRVVAGCCGSPMFVDFTPGSWLTVFRNRLAGQPCKSQMQVMTKDKLEGVVLSGDTPAYDTMPPSFMIKLLLSWAAMGFRRPKITW